MKTTVITPNNLEKALEEMKAKKIKTEKVPKEIRKLEEGYFHVVGVKILTKPGEMENEASVVCMQFNKKAYKKFESNYLYVGYDSIHVLHDPYAVEERPLQVVPQHVQSKNEADIRKELDAEYEAKFQKRLAEANVKSEEVIQSDIVEEGKRRTAEYEEAVKKDKAEKKELKEKEIEAAKRFNHIDFLKEVKGTDNFLKLKSLMKKNGVSVEFTEKEDGVDVKKQRDAKNASEAKNALFVYASKQQELLKIEE